MKGNYAFNRDHMNDRELGTGIYASPMPHVHIDPDNYADKIAKEREFIRKYSENYPTECERAQKRIEYYEKRLAEIEQKKQAVSLNEMTDEQRAEWWENDVKEVEF